MALTNLKSLGAEMEEDGIYGKNFPFVELNSKYCPLPEEGLMSLTVVKCVLILSLASEHHDFSRETEPETRSSVSLTPTLFNASMPRQFWLRGAIIVPL